LLGLLARHHLVQLGDEDAFFRRIWRSDLGPSASRLPVPLAGALMPFHAYSGTFAFSSS